MKALPLVSIIIPLRQLNGLIEEAIPYYSQLKWPNWEILIFPDQKPRRLPRWPRVKIIPSGQVGPAEKRDLALKYAQGEILAFIDDDAFPTPGWLTAAVKNFSDPSVAAVGGPGVTPPRASWGEQISGWVSASPIGAGPYTYRFLPGQKQVVEDYPSMNLLVRKTVFAQVGGFDSHYYPGEDTKLCLDIINLGLKIIYEPRAVVYHHRRPFLWPHLKQNGNFGIHRGFFARVLPKTSAKLIYFMPSLLVLYLLIEEVVVGFLPPPLQLLSISPLILYLLLVVGNGLWIANQSKSWLLGLMSIPAVWATHIWYGLRFIQGFILVKHLTR